MSLTLTLCCLAATPISFESAVAQAIEKHPSMWVAGFESARATALVEQARAGALPTLLLNSVATQLDANRVLNERVISAATQLSANAVLNVPLLAPARWAHWRRAQVAGEAIVRSADDVRRQVALSAGRAWLTVLGQQRLEHAAHLASETAQRHVEFATARRKAGMGSELDELRAEQELALSEQQLANARAVLVRAREALGVAVGVDGPLDAEDREPGLSQVDNSAGRPRSDVVAAQARLKAAEVGASFDFADYLPLLSAIVQPGYQNPPTLTVPLASFQAQLVLTVPLFDGGLRYGQQKERRVFAQQARAVLEQVQRQASAEVRTALGQLESADQALRAARVSAAKATRVLELAQAAFQAGASTNLEVVDAEARARDAATQVAIAEDASRQARLELLSASGAF